MPIDTYIAGEPGQIEALGSALSTTLYNALSDQRYSLSGPRNAYRDVWQGPAGEKVADQASELIKGADHLLDAFTKIGDAVSAFGESLGIVHDTMAGHRADAIAHDLTVTGHLIEDVPPLAPGFYPAGPLPDEAVERNQEQQAKVDAFHAIADDVDDTISTYVDACERLTDTIGDTVDEGWLADLILQVAPGSLEYLGDDVLNPLAKRLGRSRAISNVLQGLDGDAMGSLVGHMFASVNGMKDGQIVSRLAELSEKSGGALDKYLLVAGILTGLDEGESIEQAIVSESGGFLAGAGTTAITTTALTYGTTFALGGSTVGPVGTVIIGGIGLGVGTVVAIVTSNQIDEWYDDAEFEDLIRDGLQGAGEGPMITDVNELDQAMRTQVVRGSVILCSSSAVLVGALLVPVLVVGRGASAAYVAVIIVPALMLILGIDAVIRVPRRPARTVDSGIEVASTRVPGSLGLTLGLVVACAAVLALADPDIFEQRRAILLPFSALAGVGLAATGAALFWRPGTLRVTPDEVVTRRLRIFGGRSSVAWDEVEAIGVPGDATMQALRVLPVALQGGDEMVRVATASTRPTVWILIEWLEHYRVNPGDRHELADQTGIDRLNEIESRLLTGERWPRWFAPPASAR